MHYTLFCHVTLFEVRIALPVPEIIGGTQKFGQSLDTPTLHFLRNFEWAFTWIGPVNLPAKFEVRSLKWSFMYRMSPECHPATSDRSWDRMSSVCLSVCNVGEQ